MRYKQFKSDCPDACESRKASINPECRTFLKYAEDLADRILVAVEKESCGDALKRIRLNGSGYFWETDKEFLSKSLSKRVWEDVQRSFQETPPTLQEVTLSGAYFSIDRTLWLFGIVGNLVDGVYAWNFANQSYGAYLGQSDPRDLKRQMSNLAKQSHARTNYLRQEIEADYLENIGRFGSKSEAAKFYSQKYPGEISVDRIKKWLGKLPLPTNPKRKKYR